MSGANDVVNSRNSQIYDLSGIHDPSVQATEAVRGSTFRQVGDGGGKFFIKLDDGLTTNWQDITNGSINPAVFNALFDARFSTKTTSDLNEGLNLYFTTLRARAAVPEWIDGVAYSIDPLRAKKISLNRNIFSVGWDSSTVSNRYLKFQNIPLMKSNGILVPKDSVITGVWGSSETTDNWIVQIRLSGSTTPIVSEPIINGIGKNLALNIDISENSLIQIFALGNNIKNPLVHIETAYRV